jgi:hypothetical protein
MSSSDRSWRCSGRCGSSCHYRWPQAPTEQAHTIGTAPVGSPYNMFLSDRCWRCSALVNTGALVPTDGLRNQLKRHLGTQGDSNSSAFVLNISSPDKFSPALLPWGLAGYHKAPEKILVTASRITFSKKDAILVIIRREQELARRTLVCS